MSDFLDHLFNALGAGAKALKQADARRAQQAGPGPGKRAGGSGGNEPRRRVKLSFDGVAPAGDAPASSCCTAKRE